MKNTSRILTGGAMLLFFLTLCLSVQSLLFGNAFAAADGVLTLYPEETPALSRALIPEGDEGGAASIPVTADGNISDWLSPKEEGWQEKPSAQPSKSYEISGKVNVLIYHTHTNEAYRQTEDYTYEPSGTDRTKDHEKSIVRVGEELKTLLEGYGFTVIHDTTDHEPPKLTTAYDRSMATMQHYKDKYPEIQVFIDLHRDSLGLENMENDVVEIDGKRCAKVMFVVGQGIKYDDKPDFDTNYHLADTITNKLNTIAKGFCKAPRVRTGRYNQQMGKYCMLLEVGHDKNTLHDALNAMPYVAKAMSEVIKIS